MSQEVDNEVIMAASTTINGKSLISGSSIKIMFTADITGPNTTTGLSLTYNGTAYAVKVGKNGALANFNAYEVSSEVYKYLQAYTTLELAFDGTQFIIIGNPVVLSSADYTIYPDGNGRTNVVAVNNLQSVTSSAVAAFLTTAQTGVVATDYSFYFNTITKIGNIINLRLELYSGREPIAANITKFLGNIPAGFRPNNRIGLEIGNVNAGNGRLIEMWHCDISSTGDIILYTGSSVLDFAYINLMYIV